MKTAFDTSTAAFKQKTGTGVYVEELVLSYQNIFSSDEVIHSYRLSRLLKGWDHLLPLTSNSRRQTMIEPWSFLSGLKFDIFHGLNSRLPLLVGCKQVATIHDLFSVFGEFSTPAFREDQTRKLKTMIGRANHIIVPASFTKTQLVDHFAVMPDKITVVPQGVRVSFCGERDRRKSQKTVAEKFQISRPFLLFVGTLEKRKNLIGLIRSYSRLCHLTKIAPDLVLVGHEGYMYSEIDSEIKASGLADKIKILGFVGDDGLADLYTACEAFVYLSLEEGFGIPIIEAMACKAPVISSDTTSLPEAGGGFSWLVKPHDHAIVAAHILKVLARDESILDQVEKASRYARSQTWEKVARSTRQVYERLLKKTR